VQDAFTLHAGRLGAGFATRYLAGPAGGASITGPVRAGAYRTALLPPRAFRVVIIVVAVPRGARVGSSASRTLSVSSVTRPLARDVVQARVVVLRHR
jgi:hypothetical protein